MRYHTSYENINTEEAGDLRQKEKLPKIRSSSFLLSILQSALAVAATVTFPAAFLVDDGRLTAFRTKITDPQHGILRRCHSSRRIFSCLFFRLNVCTLLK